MKNLFVISNYNSDISWILDYTDNYIIYDRSDTDEWIRSFDQSKVSRVPNIGWDIYDKFTYIIDHYDNLPDVIILIKGNLFKYITRQEFDMVYKNKTFTPLFTKHHTVSYPTAFYGSDGMYYEINNSWYLRIFPAKYFKTYNDFIWRYVKKIPTYTPFAPGSNYILRKQDILQYPKSFYEKLRSYINYTAHPGEAQILERALYMLWNGDFNLKLPWYCQLQNRIETILGNILFDIRRIIPTWFKEKLRKKTRPALSLKTLREYRKKIKIYDIFTYNGEVDILDIRLHVLADVVDQFIIVEAPTTFSGKPKPLYFKEQQDRFAEFADKIIYFVIDDYPNDPSILALADSSSNVPKDGPEHWRREFYQKESIKKALVGLRDTDICFIGDVDEIWNPDVLVDYTSDAVFKLRQTVYSYYVNNRSNEPWAGTMVTKYKNIKDACLNHLRTKSKTKYTYIKNGGWHFTSIGGLDEVRRKLNDSYTDESYNTASVQQHLATRFGKEDYMGRKFTFSIDESTLPSYLLGHKEKYKHLFK